MTRRYCSANRLLLLVFLLFTNLLWSCGGGGGSGTYTNNSGGSGTLSLSLTDAATDRYKAIYVTIDAIQVHLRGNESNPNNWLSVDMPESPMTVNLLELVNGVREDLGLSDLGAGRYSQLRLIIGQTPDASINLLSQAHPHANYVIDHSDTAYPLKIPSGFNTGIKLVKGFRISANQTTELILDFDADRSVVEAGSSGKRLLKPTIAVQDASEYAIIEGVVRANSDSTVIEGAMVNLQVYDSTAGDVADEVSIRASTISDATGEYRIFAVPGTYYLVTYVNGYEAANTPVTTVTGQIQEIDVSLTESSTGVIGGNVSLPDANTEQYATLSFRQTMPNGVSIEIKALNTLEGPYSVDLPVGTFQIVASSYGYNTEEYDITIPDIDEQNIVLNK